MELTSKPVVIITEKLQKQIDYLHSKIGNSEWSGELITREEGTINDLGEWKIICEDIFLADIGTSGATEYTVDKGGFKSVDVVEMYTQFPGLMDGTLKNQHIHSHINFGVFFSGTDWEQLEDRGCISNYLLMLIVNMKKEACAKVGFKANISGQTNRVLSFANNIDEMNDISLTDNPSKELLVVMDCIIKHETPEIEVDTTFSDRYEKVKAAIEEESKYKYDASKNNYGKNGNYGQGILPFKSEKKNWNEDWEIKNGVWTEKNKRKKSVMDMTDKEWEKENREKVTVKEAKALINAVLSSSHTLCFDDPVKKILKKNNELKTTGELYEWINTFILNLKEYFDIIFTGNYNDEDYLDMLCIINEEILQGSKYNRLISEMSQYIDWEIDSLSTISVSHNDSENKHNLLDHAWY